MRSCGSAATHRPFWDWQTHARIWFFYGLPFISDGPTDRQSTITSYPIQLEGWESCRKLAFLTIDLKDGHLLRGFISKSYSILDTFWLINELT